MERAYPEIRAEGAELLAISVDNLDDARQMQVLTGATFPVLADPDHAVTATYGLFDLLGDDVSAPATIVLTSEEIIGANVGQDIGDRVPAALIVELLRKFNAGTLGQENPQGTGA